MMLKQVLKF